jgi:NADH-quinone oxidoreductase subunit J
LPTLEIIIFAILAIIAIGAAVMMIVTKNAVHSAIFLVVVMACLAIFFLGLSAPFVAMVQVAVYAGAIMVLFLFVIMLLGAEKIGARSPFAWQAPIAIVLALIVLGVVGFLLFNGQQPIEVQNLPTAQIVQGSAEAIGQSLFTTYLFPFEATSILLLVAMIGAVVLVKTDKKKIS